MSIASLPLFQAADEGVTDPLLYEIVQRAKSDPDTGNFAYYQDEGPFAFYLSLRRATEKVLGKQKVQSGDLPANVEAFLTRMGDVGSRAMTAAEYRECTDAELEDEIDDLKTSLSKKSKAHGGKLRPGATRDTETDMNRQIATEWLEIAQAERCRRQSIRGFDHLRDIERRACEKFGDDGLRILNLYVTQNLAFDALDSDQEVLINGNPLPQIGEGIEAIPMGDTAAAERFVKVLATARRDQDAGLPAGVAVTYGPRHHYRSWTEDECREAARAHEGVISFGDGVAGEVSVDAVHWHYEDRFRIDAFLHSGFTAERWALEFAFEQELKARDGFPGYYNDMVWARIGTPIICIWHGDHCHIMDGYHRVGSRFFCRIPTVPAIVGVRYADIEAAKAARKTKRGR